jgi:hypothetical protein
VIRQAISCDICGNEKQQTNHWFVAHEQNEELRLSGWSSRNRLRSGTRHLCGQTCLHKLVDDFMARAIGQKTANATQLKAEMKVARTDATLISSSAYDDFDLHSSARLITPSITPISKPTGEPAAELIAVDGKAAGSAVIPPPEEPRYASPAWRAEAWQREREREMRAHDCRSDLVRRRANG